MSENHFTNYFDNSLIINNHEQNIKIIKPKTLTEIVKSTNFKHINLLVLDVEGHEYEVLLSWDFLIPIDIILMETLEFNEQKNQMCRDILITNNYSFIKKCHHNEIFALNSYIHNNDLHL